ncbi:hypothetical protein BDA96_10G157100 [Sorghum bicolor]|uniref:Uncharacterized protein n=1 Tax=Sorghum bicolor TaxID=4558 RepID=A0A921U122_SORBI|nr:hypothetical protein BDA96_10G157100 [Sorghum bicolor]
MIGAAARGSFGGFPKCMGCGTRGRGFLSRVSGLRHLGKRVSSPSASAAALGEEGFFPECLGCCARRRGFFPRVLHSEKIFFKKRKWHRPSTNGVNSSASDNTALGKGCARFLALGEGAPVRRLPGDTFLSVALGEGFPKYN